MEKAAVRPAVSSINMNWNGKTATSAEIMTLTSNEKIAVRESKKTRITSGMAAKGTKYMPLPTYSNIRIANIANIEMNEIRNTMFFVELRNLLLNILRNA